MTEHLEEIQPEDTTDTDQAVENVLQKLAREYTYEQEREREADLRELMRATQSALVGETDHDVDELLGEILAYLSDDPNLPAVLAPGYEDLADKVKLSFHRFARRRDQGDVDKLPHLQEYRTYVRVAIALEIIHSGSDFTRYAPVTLEKLDVPGARSPVEGRPTPIGRVRVSGSSATMLEDRAAEISHRDPEHIIAIANPREGKDAFLARVAGNLKDEHGYKWFSVHDDGRDETKMIACPNDEEPIQRSLESFGQSPKGYPTEVFVPAIGLSDALPRNHRPFTFGVDALTPELVGQLSGVSPDASTERRIKLALKEAGGSVDELIRLLNKYAEDTSAEVTVTELKDDEDLADGEDTHDLESRTVTYQMGEDKVLEECAHSLMLLSSDGLLRNRGAETNLDIVDVLDDQETVAVLDCNNLPEGDEHLQGLLELIWLRLIHEARDDHQHLPRAAVELREIKQLAPSTLERADYSNKVAKALRQTLLFLTSQGGSRRILLLGSTQYLRDVFLPVRGNMPIKVLLKMGEEKISILESAGFDFTTDERYQLQNFNKGWGMLLEPSGKTYPINWTGPKCALGLGDLDWRSRYATAMGFRTEYRSVATADAWRHDAEAYYDHDGVRRKAPPDRGEWYLLKDDIADVDQAAAGQVTISESVLLEAAKERQAYPVGQDLRPAPVEGATQKRELNLISTEEAQEREEDQVFQRFDVHGVLRDWTRREESTIEKMCRVLRAVRDHEIESYQELADVTGISKGSIKMYANEETQLDPCLVKEDGVYQLKPIGNQALEVSWSAVFREVE
jgi:hypothetical protein